MARDYKKIGKKITLEGFFSEYLPPCFKLDENMIKNIPKQNCDLIEPYKFTMSRMNKNNARRNIYIPEFGSYLVAQNFMNQNNIIKDLIELSDKSTVSYSKILNPDDDIIFHEESYDISNEDVDRIVSEFTNKNKSSYINNIAKKIVNSSGANKLIQLDISNCYSSFYSHYIPAIVLGKDKAEEEYKKSVNGKNSQVDEVYNTYRELDKVIRNQNLARTNGLLTGPLSSKIIIEGILSRIDQELVEEGIVYSRYVDDYEVYIYDENEKEILNYFEKILKKYGFSINYEKKQIEEFPFYIVNDLEKKIIKWQESLDSDLIEISHIIEIFDDFSKMEKNGIKGAIKYLVKTLNNSNYDILEMIVKKKNKLEEIEILECISLSDDEEEIEMLYKLYNAYLINVLCNDDRSLHKTCELLVKINAKSKLNVENIDIIVKLLGKHLVNGYDLEVLWILYLLIKLDFFSSKNEMKNNLINNILESDNELAQVMILTSNLLSPSKIKKISSKAKSWILLYELYAKDLITDSEFTKRLEISKNHEMYKKLKEKDKHFCRFD